ncbi:MAG: VOC family protein [Hyphomonas sp.]|uniref:VOC family protein n=1 Tax=Hyphomonas sp. TaxID=87 RepID=UPI003526EFB4
MSAQPFLWIEDQAEEAARFYVSLLPDSEITDVERQDGKAFVVSFTLSGVPYKALNGGPYYKLSPAFSIMVTCDGQAEVDRLWSALTEGGAPLQCGWLTDRFGVTWQIVPRQFFDLRSAGTPAQTKAIMDAMMPMVKLDVAALEAAFRAAGEDA